MKRAPILPGVDLRVYLDALPILVKNPLIIIVPLLTLVIGGVLQLVMLPFAGGDSISQITSSIVLLITNLLEIFGLGAACIMADTAWRRGTVKFDDAWSESRRKSGDLISVGIGIVFLMFVASYIGGYLGPLGIILMALVAFGLIWAVPAAAIGGIPGAAAVSQSIERVRAAPLAAGVLAAVSILIGWYLPFALSGIMGSLIAGSATLSIVVHALIESICIAYIAIVMAKTYTDTAFGRRW